MCPNMSEFQLGLNLRLSLNACLDTLADPESSEIRDIATILKEPRIQLGVPAHKKFQYRVKVTVIEIPYAMGIHRS